MAEETPEATEAAEATASAEVEDNPKNQKPSPASRVLGPALLAVGAIVIVMIAFIWPAQVSEPRNISVGVSASDEDFAELNDELDGMLQGEDVEMPFDLKHLDEDENPRHSVESNETFGAIVLPSEGNSQMEAYVATAASPEAAQMVANLAQNLGQMAMQEAQMSEGDDQPSQEELQAMMQGPQIEDVVQISQNDPQGRGLSIALMPMTVGGIFGAALIALAVRGRTQRLAATLVFAVVASAIIAFLVGPLFSLLPGSFLALWPTFALALLATQAIVVGLHSLIGKAGIALGAALTFLIGLPIAGVLDPWQYLPASLGQVGQFLIPGASATLLKIAAYFPVASLTKPLVVLFAWAVAGLILISTGRHHATPVAALASNNQDDELPADGDAENDGNADNESEETEESEEKIEN